MKKITTYFGLIRPKTLLWFSISTCYGFASIIQQKFPNAEFFILVLTIVLANVAAIIINDVADIETVRRSPEASKQKRPLVTGSVSKKEAIIIAVFFYLLSLLTSFAYGAAATLFSLVVIVFSLAYSLPPTRFSARPISSILYWVILCIACYLLLLNALAASESELYSYLLLPAGWAFIMGIVLFMGIAEIIAKDLRDLVNDKEGGRNTFVNSVGVSKSSIIMFVFAWVGFGLWITALYSSNSFPASIPGFTCFTLGFSWCVYITFTAKRLSRQYDQILSQNLHQGWTYVYAIMQGLTCFSFVI